MSVYAAATYSPAMEIFRTPSLWARNPVLASGSRSAVPPPARVAWFPAPIARSRAGPQDYPPPTSHWSICVPVSQAGRTVTFGL